MAVTAPTFHMSPVGLLRTVLTRIAVLTSPMTTTCSFVLGQYQPMSRTPIFPSMSTSSGIVRARSGQANTCSPISRTAVALFLQLCHKCGPHDHASDCALSQVQWQP